MLSKPQVLYMSAARTKAQYYSDQEEDYYSKEGDSRVWHGKGAEVLGLSGDVQVEDFYRLLQGEVEPGKVRSMTTPGGAKSRSGFDFTFSPPKSVTLQALLGKDARIIEILDRAVANVAKKIEQDAKARMTVDGVRRVEDSANIIAASFRHETARPVLDAPPDPQVHHHLVVMNLTQRSDGKWVSLHNEWMFRNQKEYDAQYMAEVAAGLQAIGYQLRWDARGNFELAHFTREQIMSFSKRSQQIEVHLEEKGLNRQTASMEQKQAANLATRQAKSSALTREELNQGWEAQASDLAMDFSRRDWAGAGKAAGLNDASPRPGVTVEEIADTAVAWATKHLSERESVIAEADLVVTALRHSGGQADLDAIRRAISQRKANGHLVQGETRYRSASSPELPAMTRRVWASQMMANISLSESEANARVAEGVRQGRLLPTSVELTTVEHRQRERRILSMELAGRSAVPSIMEAQAAGQPHNWDSLTAGQRSAVEQILTTTDRFVGVEGWAGTGKSHMLKPAIAKAQEHGYRVLAVAPYGMQVKALRELGVEGGTVAAVLKGGAERFPLDERTIVIVDEAGVMPAVDAERLMHRVEEGGARMVMLGDRSQTKAIQAGAPFEQLINAGMATARMTQVVRQKDRKLRRAVELAAGGAPGKALKLIDEVISVRKAEARYSQIAKAYGELTPAARDKTLIITGTNESRQEINAAIRRELGLEGTGRQFNLLTRHDSTEAERGHSRYFQVGDVIQPERDYGSKGLVKGVAYRVVDTGPGNKLTVKAPDEAITSFNPSQVRKVSVYRENRAELAAGDWVRATRNFAKQDIANGDRMRVEAIREGEIDLLLGGRRITMNTAKPLHLDTAYVTTVHSAQGLTYDHVIANLEVKSQTTKSDTFYVGASRGRESVVIYTDNLSKLPSAISRLSKKRKALDIGKERGPEKGKGAVLAGAQKSLRPRSGLHAGPGFQAQKPAQEEYGLGR